MWHKLCISSMIALFLLLCGLQADTTSGDADIDKHALAATADDEASLDKLAKYLARPCKSDRDKARVIYRWITDRIAYNAEGFFSGNYGDNKSASVLEKRLAVCEGYSALYTDLSKRMDLETARVGGYAKGMTYVADQPVGDRENHTWVAVRIEGHWQLVEPTWGAGYIAGKKFVKRFNDYYFLPAPDQLLFTHLPSELKWQLVKAPLSAEEFQRRPRVDHHLFNLRVSGEAVQSAIAEQGFRGLVQVYAHPSSSTFIVKAPLKKYLVADADYEFKLESGDYVEMAVFNDETFVPMERDGKVFAVKVKPKKGMLHVTGRKSKNDKAFSSVLGYLVE